MVDTWRTPLQMTRKDGEIILLEPYTQTQYRSKDCGAIILTTKQIDQFFTSNGFVLKDSLRISGKPGNVPYWVDVPEEQMEEKILLRFKAVAN